MTRGDFGSSLFVLCAVAVVSACVTPSAPAAPVNMGPGPGGSTAKSGQDAAGPVKTLTPGPGGSAVPMPACPAKYGDPGPSCDGPAPACSYPQGNCYCGEEPRCSGVEREPEPPHWVCVREVPPCPAAGTPCSGDTQCAPWCCGMGVVCKDGVFVPEHFPCPP